MNEMNKKQTKIYNNIIDLLEKTYVINLGELYVKGYVRGYILAIMDTGKLTANEAFQIDVEIEDVIDDMLEVETKND